MSILGLPYVLQALERLAAGYSDHPAVRAGCDQVGSAMRDLEQAVMAARRAESGR